MSAVQQTMTASEIPTFHVAGDTIRLMAGSSTSRFELFEIAAAENSGPPAHNHDWEEFYYVAEGELDLTVNGLTTRLTAGAFASVTRGSVHTHRVASSSARFVLMASPGGVSRFFHEIDRETQGSVDDIGKILEIAQKHGSSARCRSKVFPL